jgi:hypothetical protein
MYITLIKCMRQHSYWEANSLSASQVILFLVLNTKVYYRVHKGSLLNNVLRQMNTVNTLAPFFFKINFNIILQKLIKKHRITLVLKHHEDLCGMEEKLQAEFIVIFLVESPSPHWYSLRVMLGQEEGQYWKKKILNIRMNFGCPIRCQSHS